MSNGGGNKKASSGFHFLAGLGSGCTTAFLLQPADLLKTRVQQSRSSTLREALREVLSSPNPVRSLWRGTTPSLIRTGFGSALYFGMLNQMRTYAVKVPDLGALVPAGQTTTQKIGNAVAGAASSTSVLPKLGNMANLTTGAMARVAAGFIMNPVTVLKVRYESSYYAYTSMLSAARDIAAKEGLRGYFAGFGATAARDAPYAGLYVLVYEQAKARLGAASRWSGVDTSTTSSSSKVTANFAAGVIAAISATTMTNPFDAIKTRLQLMPGRYSNMLHAASRMLKEEGIRSFFDGLSLRIGRKALSSALAWTVYEELIRRAEQRLV